jgi:hypothetical protein
VHPELYIFFNAPDPASHTVSFCFVLDPDTARISR